MATTNVTENEKQNYSETIQDLFCSVVIASTLHGQLTFIAVLNAFLSITAFLGNVLVLAALRKDSSLHPPSKLLLCSLALTDLCAGMLSEPLYVTLLVTVVNEHWSICRYVEIAFPVIARILTFSSLLTLTAISVDRLTSCPVVGVEIQTGCYFEANPFDHHHHLGAAFELGNSGVLLWRLYNFKVRGYSYFTVSSNLNLLSYKNFPYPSSSSKSSTRPRSTTQPN